MEFRRVLFRSFEHRTARVAERVDASRVAVECVQGGLETFACSAEAHVQSLGEAQERLNALELLSNRMLDRVAHSGIRTPDTPYIELALVGAEEVRAIVETALATGELQPGQLFDTSYVPLPGHEPRKYMTGRSEEHTSEPPVTNAHLVCRLLLEKKKTTNR